MCEWRNSAASAESFTLVALRSNISDSKSFRAAFLIPDFLHSESGLQAMDMLRASASASSSAWLAPWPLNGLMGWAASPIRVTWFAVCRFCGWRSARS